MTRTATSVQRKGLTLLPLIAATYFMVSGGPYGLEDLVQKSGYGWALLLLAVTPIIWSLPVALMVGCALWNIAGARAVGNGSVLLMYALLAPFIILMVAAFFHRGDYAPAQRRPEFDLVGGILVAMWNYMGWDNASTIAREVDDPQRTYPRAMLGAVAGTATSYLIPVAVVAPPPLDAPPWPPPPLARPAPNPTPPP